MNAMKHRKEDEMSEPTKPEVDRTKDRREPTTSVPTPGDDVPPIDDAPVPPLTSPDETQGG